MPAITDPRAIAFTQLVRKVADVRLTDYYTCVSLVDEWFGQSMSGLIPNDASVISDGAGTGSDGRPVATGAVVTNIITRAQDIIGDMQANSNAKLNTLIALSGNFHASQI